MNTDTDATLLLDFEDPAEIALFRPIDDVVMGGVSRSRFEPAGPGVAAFRGEVSLARGGGFASVRSEPREWATSGARSILLRIKGDGKQYKLTLRTDDAFDGVQYQARFQPPAGEWIELRLPASEFAATFRGRVLSDAPRLDPARIRTLGLMISEKQAGPFELLVDWIAVAP
jgi:monofunctional biosynthetic peptidoglycan transglycosylase